jgi:hypothetical protein
VFSQEPVDFLIIIIAFLLWPVKLQRWAFWKWLKESFVAVVGFMR